MPLSTPVVKASATPVATAAITSSAFTPTANALVVAVCVNTGSTSANAQGTISSTHSPALSWTAGGVTGGGNTTGAVRWWYAQAGSAPGSGTVTVTLGAAPTIQDLVVFEVTGQNPTTPVAGRVGASATTATSISGTLAAAPLAADLSIGIACTRNKSTVPTVGTGFTSLDSAASATPSATYLIEYRTGSTSTTVDANAVGTTWTGLEAFNIKAGGDTAQVENVYAEVVTQGKTAQVENVWAEVPTQGFSAQIEGVYAEVATVETLIVGTWGAVPRI